MPSQAKRDVLFVAFPFISQFLTIPSYESNHYSFCLAVACLG
jgi:hypothetical protein